MAACTGPLLGFLCNCLVPWYRRDVSWSETLRMALHTFFVACCFVVLVQQISFTTEMYHLARQQYSDAVRLYAEEDCVRYRGPSRARLQECSELAMIIGAYPMMRALIRVTQSWNTCLYMSCGDLITAVSQQLQYKIVLVLVALALTSYIFRLFQCTKKKTQKLISAKRLQATLERLNSYDATATTMTPKNDDEE